MDSWGSPQPKRTGAPTRATPASESKSGDNTEFDHELMTERLEKLSSDIQRLERGVQALATPKDSEDHRDKQEKLRGHIRAQCRSIDSMFKKARDNSRIVQKLKTQAEELQKKAMDLITESQKREREVGNPIALDLDIPEVEEETQEEQIQATEKRPRKGFVRGAKALKDGDFEMQFETAAEIELQLADEKRQGIESMANELDELHDLYQDVATLVSTQQEDLNTVDKNVEVALHNTTEGVKMLEEAAELKKSGDRKRNIIVCILVVLLILVAGGITTGVVVAKKATGK